MVAGNEPGSSTGNLTSSNCRYFIRGGKVKLPVVIIQQPGENADKGLSLTRRQRCEQFILGVGQQGVEPPQVCPALSLNPPRK
jgi:hypothetical protein